MCIRDRSSARMRLVLKDGTFSRMVPRMVPFQGWYQGWYLFKDGTLKDGAFGCRSVAAICSLAAQSG
eukprot:269976-Prorocentrum_lima.AAC.1